MTDLDRLDALRKMAEAKGSDMVVIPKAHLRLLVTEASAAREVLPPRGRGMSAEQTDCTCQPLFAGHVVEHPDCPRGRVEITLAARAAAPPVDCTVERMGGVRCRAAAPPVERDNEARYREHDDEGNHIADHPVRAAPPVAEGIVQQAHVPCCWCGEHHEAGA